MSKKNNLVYGVVIYKIPMVVMGTIIDNELEDWVISRDTQTVLETAHGFVVCDKDRIFEGRSDAINYLRRLDSLGTKWEEVEYLQEKVGHINKVLLSLLKCIKQSFILNWLFRKYA